MNEYNQNNQSQRRRLFRHAILLQCEAAYPASLPADTLLQGLRLSGHPADESALLREVVYLQEKGFCDVVRPELSQDLPRYRLTANGRDYLEGQGLA